MSGLAGGSGRKDKEDRKFRVYRLLVDVIGGQGAAEVTASALRLGGIMPKVLGGFGHFPREFWRR